MMTLDNAITCHGQSWGSECQVCEQEAYADYIREMHDDYESKYVDSGDMEDYEEEE
jgi:NAD-dependent SIR2 family protein deacetylase